MTFKAQSKFGKAFSRLQMIIHEFFEKGIHYSWWLAIYNTAWWIGNYCHPLVKLQFWGKMKITEWMDNHISKNLQSTSPDMYSNSNISTVKDYHIWVFWWQGVENMPKLVKGCYSQLCSHNKNVVLVTRDNVNQYCHIPSYIYDKVKNGTISFTHFSDIVRVTLLAEHGGMWIDSTCWIAREVTADVKLLPLISPKTLHAPDFPWWSNSRWCSWCLGTSIINNPLFVYTRDFFFLFFKHHSYFPFYLLQDYLYDYAYRKSSNIMQMIDEIPENNVKRGQLHFMLNKPWNQQEYEELTKDNWVFKLSYKTIWKERYNGQPTFYAKLMKDKTAK